MPAKKVQCPICGADMIKGENKIPLMNPVTKREKIVYGYRCTRCGYKTAR
jgi:C4-type Zn-finger protein